MNSLPETKRVDTVKLYRNLTCASCGKKMTKSIKPQGEAKCRPCLQPNAKVRELTCKQCKNSFKSIVQADYCSNLCHSRDYERVGYNCIECGVTVVRHSVRCRPCASQEIAERTVDERAKATAERLKKEQARKQLLAQFAKPKVLRVSTCEACDCVCASFTRATRLCTACSDERLKARIRNGQARRRARMRGVYTERFNIADVYERDGYMCLLCNEPLNMQAKMPDPLSPTIDHIIPISLNGPHTKNNVRSAHLLCNSIRGNKYDPLIDVPFE